MRRWMLALLTISLFAALPSQAAIYGFTCISSTGCSAGDLVSGQLYVAITDAGSGNVKFRFGNTASPTSKSSIITEIAWDDPTTQTPLQTAILDFSTAALADSGSNVTFNAVAVPGKNPPTPTGFTPSFEVNASTDSASKGGVDNGINNSTSDLEWLEVTVALRSGKTFDNLLTAIANNYFNIGLHVQSLESGGSATYELGNLLDEPPPVPEPSSYFVALALGLAGIFWSSRRRQSVR